MSGPREAETQRETALDLIRALASLFVVSVHFFLHAGLYSAPLRGEKLWAMVVLRDSFMVCVPLFLLLSGCLCRGKRLTARYYLGLGRALATYALAGCACQAFRCLYLGEGFSAARFLCELFSCTAAPYGWYVEMYIGLFLLIPLLNAGYAGVGGRREKRVLVLSLAALTALPPLVNLNGKLMPDWWASLLYPVTYYLIGAYLGEFRPKVRPLVGVPLLAALGVGLGTFNFLRNYGGLLIQEPYNDWYGPSVMLCAALLFALLRELPLGRLPGFIKRLLGRLSGLSLGIYLVSWCFDVLFYAKLHARVPELTDKLPYFFLVVPAIYACSALAAQGIEWCRRGLARALKAGLSGIAKAAGK